MDIKSILLAILVGYLVLDLASSLALKRGRPLLPTALMNVKGKDRKMTGLSVLVAVVAAAGTYYLAHNYA